MLKRIGKKRKWSQERIVREIREFHQKGLPLNVTYLLGHYSALYSAMIKYFGTYGKAIEASGLDYCEIKRQLKRKKFSKWSPEKTIKEILKLYRRQKPVHSRFIQSHLRTLYNAALRYFGTYQKAVEAAGLDYEQIKVRRWGINKWIKSLDDKKMEELRQRIERLEGGGDNES